jgi:hypothetical protein
MIRVKDKYATIIILFILPVVMTVSVKGQQVNMAVFGGINASQVQGDSYTGYNKLGFSAGFIVNRNIDKDIYWQAEIKYGTRGVYKGPSDGDQTLYRSSYHILELPLSVHYLHDEKLMVEIGTSPELLITTLYWDENGVLEPSNYPDNRRFGLNVFAGIGYWFNPRWMVGLRYTNSALPFRDPQEWNNPQNRGYFHSVIGLSLAFRVGHQKSGT